MTDEPTPTPTPTPTPRRASDTVVFSGPITDFLAQAGAVDAGSEPTDAGRQPADTGLEPADTGLDPAAAVADPPARGAGEVVVELKGVGKLFAATSRTGSGVEALRDIDLDIERGEFISLIGPSGCGKSTLLRVVGDLTPASSGTVTVHGKPARQARLDRDYGMVFQAPVLFDWRTVQRNVELPLEITGMGRTERAAKAREMLGLVELEDFADHHPWQLSGGMQQRAAIARALALDPALLLMDEPFGALDEMTRERMNLELLRIWERTGTTVIFVTHSIPEAVFLSTRVVVMSARPGRITKIVPIDLPRQRDVETREMERYFELVTEVREALRGIEAGGDGERPGDATRRVAAEGLSA